MERTQIQSSVSPVSPAQSRLARVVAAVQPRTKKQPVQASSACHTRIIALVPDADLNEARFAQALQRLSQQHLAPILLMTVVPHYAREANARLRLALVAALLRDAGFGVEMDIAVARDWVSVIGQHQSQGDLVLCQAEHELPHGKGAEPIAVQLREAGLHVQEMSGYLIAAATPTRLQWLLGWLAPLSVIAVGFVVQAVLLRWMQAQAWAEAAQHAVLILTVLAEAVAVMFFINKE